MKINFYILFITFFFISIASANENDYYLILKNNKVNVRYGPGFNYQIKYIYKKKNLPIKVIDKKENFRRIIDFKKNSGWIHISQLKKGKSVILLKDQILFKKPTKYSKPILKIAKGRLLLVKKCKKKWCRVKTENYTGWIKSEKVWGAFK
jgi:SH3-like domain-containing protein